VSLLRSLPAPLAERVRPLGDPSAAPRFVLYWMRTAVRAHQNPALDVALTLGRELGVGVFVYHALSERYPYASDRHHTFILEGARDVAAALTARGIGTAFHLEREGHRGPHLRTLAEASGLVVTEDLPVPPLTGWTEALHRRTGVPVLRVDTACVAPMQRSTKAPARAFAFRKARQRDWDERLAAGWTEQPNPGRPFVPDLPFEPVDLGAASLPDLVAACRIDHAVGPVPHTVGGSSAGYARWRAFVEDGRLRRYDRLRNDPNKDGASRMSAYLHYGMVSPLRLALEAAEDDSSGARKYLDELLTWRELAHAFCLRTPVLDTLAALPEWARATLDAHRDDPREVLDWETLARGHTGDPVWDAAQRSLLVHGELHNNVRMTWGKALPRWAETPERALSLLIDLNHRYALDGRDPNSYGGLLWCLGRFDRPFGDAPILGSIRGRSTARVRFDVGRYREAVRRPARARSPRVAVVGAGLAGLFCARTLADHGTSVVVFDKGRGLGGRMATRRRDGGQWDHGAQYFTARDPRFRRYVEAWARQGLLARWDEGHVRLREGGVVVQDQPTAPRWVGVGTMNRVHHHLAAGLEVRRGVAVDPLEPARGGRITLRREGRDLDTFDLVVSTAPATQTARLLAEASPELAARAEAVVTAPCWAALLRLEEGAPTYRAAFVEADGPLAWLAHDRSKPGREGGETWVAHARPTWSAAHLEETPEAVAEQLAEAFATLTGSPPPIEAAAHRWRYAKTEEPVGAPFLFDAEARVAAAGDWCLGAKVEAAFLSGAALAGRILGEAFEVPPRQGELAI
jgi:photolyase PhrII